MSWRIGQILISLWTRVTKPHDSSIAINWDQDPIIKNQKAIILEIDGPLALHSSFPWDTSIPNAKINQWCLDIIRVYSGSGHEIIFVTDRQEIYRHLTTEWLLKHKIYACQYTLLMYPGKYKRSTNLTQYRVNTIQRLISKYSIELAIDDSILVARAISGIGIKCLVC